MGFVSKAREKVADARRAASGSDAGAATADRMTAGRSRARAQVGEKASRATAAAHATARQMAARDGRRFAALLALVGLAVLQLIDPMLIGQYLLGPIGLTAFELLLPVAVAGSIALGLWFASELTTGSTSDLLGKLHRVATVIARAIVVLAVVRSILDPQGTSFLAFVVLGGPGWLLGKLFSPQFGGGILGLLVIGLIVAAASNTAGAFVWPIVKFVLGLVPRLLGLGILAVAGALGYIAYGLIGLLAVVVRRPDALHAMPISANANRILNLGHLGSELLTQGIPDLLAVPQSTARPVAGGAANAVKYPAVITIEGGPGPLVVVDGKNVRLEPEFDIKVKKLNAQTVDDAELFAVTRATAYAVKDALVAGMKGGSDGQGGKRAPAFTYAKLTISCWTAPAWHAVVVHDVEPSAALGAVRKMAGEVWVTELQQQLPISHAEGKERLMTDDGRIKNDSQFAGERGFYLTFARSQPEAAEATDETARTANGDPYVKAMFRRLDELKRQDTSPTPIGASRFELKGSPEDNGWDATTYRFGARGNWATFDELKQLIGRWEVAGNSVAPYMNKPSSMVSAGFDEDTREFVLTLRRTPPPFPGNDENKLDPDLSLYRFIKENQDELGRRFGQFVIGLNDRRQRVWVNLTNPTTPHMIVAGQAGSGKSVGGFMSPMLQMAAGASPDDLEIWVADSSYKEIVGLLGDLPHMRYQVIANTPSEALELLNLAEAEGERRLASRGNYKWVLGGPDPMIVVAIEEFQALRELSVGNKDEVEAQAILDAKLSGLAAKYRKVGIRFFVLSQKADNNYVPAGLRVNLQVHVTGSLPAADLQLLHEEQKIANFPGPAGRLAISGIPGVAPRGQPVAVHGLAELVPPLDDPSAASDRGIRMIVEELIIPRWGKRDGGDPLPRPSAPAGARPHPDVSGGEPAWTRTDHGSRGYFEGGDGPRPQPTNASAEPRSEPASPPVEIIPDDTLTNWPRRPTQAETSAMDQDFLTAGRIAWDMLRAAFTEGQTVVLLNRDTFAAHIRSIGLTAPGNDILARALRFLNEIGLTVPGPRADQKQVRSIGWPVARHLIVEALARRDTRVSSDEPAQEAA